MPPDIATLLAAAANLRAQADAIERAVLGEGPGDLLTAGLVSNAEAARATGRSKQAMRAWAKRNKASLRIGGRVYVRAEQLIHIVRRT